MSNVTLRIGGRDYTVACAAGEETHISRLGERIEAKLASLQGHTGLGEARGLLFAALFLADELHDTQSRAKEALKTLEDATMRADSALAAQADTLERLAERIENLASRLEQSVTKA